MTRKETIAEGVDLYLGDCREILPTLGKIDVVVTDPPYGHGVGTRVIGSNTNDPCIVGDVKQNRASDRVLDDTFVRSRDEALAASMSQRAIVFGTWRAPRPKETRMRVIWDKGRIGVGGFGPWRPSDEEIYILGTGWIESRDTPTVIQSSPVSSFEREHPTPKPVDLMVRVVKWCQPHWNIVDPFMGSGTTGVAAVKLRRKFVGIEVEPKYFDVARRRIQAAYDAPDLFIEPPPPAKQEVFEL